MGKQYVPQRGDLVWLNFNPQAGYEQSGKRPAVVLSPIDYNKKVGLIICCPITSQSKGYPFEVEIPVGVKISGVILADQVKSMDCEIREVEFIDKLPHEILNEVIQKLAVLLQ
ncbi:MAG: mRNA-degrading endonuclease [Ignavibacteria bacterium RBG_13_36_8]|nr:MAG: mRNA-degrading endonuclease [Ignavibacteria bacterium RBG_13_36_8]